MKRAELEKLVKSLAKSHGFYGLILLAIEQSSNSEEMWQYLEEKNFKDEVDFRLFMEQEGIVE